MAEALGDPRVAAAKAVMDQHDPCAIEFYTHEEIGNLVADMLAAADKVDPIRISTRLFRRLRVIQERRKGSVT